MAPLLDLLTSISSTTVGVVIYSLVQFILVLGAWLFCLFAKPAQAEPVGKRIKVGLSLLLIAQVVSLGISAAAWMMFIDAHTYLPPIERALAIFSLVLVIWLWAFPEPEKFMDRVVIGAEVILLGAGIIGLAVWLRESQGTMFNESYYGGFPFFTGLIIMAIGFVLILWRRASYFGFGLVQLIVVLAGYAGQYKLGKLDADYSGFAHLGEMISYVFLLILPMRIVRIRKVGQMFQKKQKQMAPTRVDASMVQSIHRLLTVSSSQQYYPELARLVANLTDAAGCLLFMLPRTGEQVIVLTGYDRANDRMIEGYAVDGHKIPSLIEPLKNNQTMRLPAGKFEAEARALADDLGVTKANLMIVPFQPKGYERNLGVAVYSKPKDHPWAEEDCKQLTEVLQIFATKTDEQAKVVPQPSDQGDLETKLQSLQAFADQMTANYDRLKDQYDSMAAQHTAPIASEDTVMLLEVQKNLQERIKQLETRNRELEVSSTSARPSMEEVEQLRQELRSALTDLARIPSTLSISDQRMLEQQLTAVKSLDDLKSTELASSIAQEIRQPLSTITGYTDLLLGESVGILGAMQRRFLERVKASAERMGVLLTELVHVISTDASVPSQAMTGVELKPTIDEVVEKLTGQLTEKNISLQMDIPDDLPIISAGKDEIVLILANLFNNACMATPADGQIKLATRVEPMDGTNFILISLADQGGGIRQADIPRVFKRRYKDENPLIHGVGDNGVGLSIVKSLVELHKGRIWVDTQEGFGSTFSILLPAAG